MKALTVRQPWAWAIAAGHKTIENRGRGAQHWHPMRDLAIHAGLKWSHRGAADERVIYAAIRDSSILSSDLRSEQFPTGVIVALVDVVDVHPFARCCEPWGESSYRLADGSVVQRVTHLVLDNVRQVDPVPCRGMLGLWTVPPDVERAIRRR